MAVLVAGAVGVADAVGEAGTLGAAGRLGKSVGAVVGDPVTTATDEDCAMLPPDDDAKPEPQPTRVTVSRTTISGP